MSAQEVSVMKVFPTLERVRAIAEEHQYDVVPLSCELLSDFITPIETIRSAASFFRTLSLRSKR